jgi:hypothetical protein
MTQEQIDKDTQSFYVVVGWGLRVVGRVLILEGLLRIAHQYGFKPDETTFCALFFGVVMAFK